MLSAGRSCCTATRGAHAERRQHDHHARRSSARLFSAAAVVPPLQPPPAAPQCQANSNQASSGSDGAQQQQPLVRRGRKKAALSSADSEQLVQALGEGAALSPAAARHILAAAQRQAGFPRDAAKLCSRVAALQQLLGPEHASAALRAFPRLVTYSAETLAHNYQQWQAFFAPDVDQSLTAAAAAGEAGEAAAAGEQQEELLLARLAHSPQLLTVNVERQVGNLYEAGVMLGAQDLHEFAFRTMSLARTQPSTLSEKLRTTLDFLNSALQQYHQQRQQHQAEQPARHDAGGSSSSGGEEKAMAEQPQQQQQQQQLQSVVMAQLHKAATRDHSWLSLASATLQQRLHDLARELQLPLPTVVAMFLQQPSIVNKRPALLGERAAALQQLPGVGPARAAAMIAALPTILQLQPATVQQRWQQLQQAAASHPAWADAVAALSPTTTAGLLIRSQVRYERLRDAAAAGWQAAYSPATVLNATPARYAKMLLKQEQLQRRRRRQRQPDEQQQAEQQPAEQPAEQQPAELGSRRAAAEQPPPQQETKEGVERAPPDGSMM